MLVCAAAVATIAFELAAHAAEKNTGPRPGSEPTGMVAGVRRLMFSSSDVPKVIPDFDANGVTSTVAVSGVGIVSQIVLTLDDLAHTCDPDLHIELTSPAGTTVVLVAASSENGILAGLSCPQNFMSTELDDRSLVNLRDGIAPYGGRFNLAHASVGEAPLSMFNGENGDGTWTLHVSDRNADDTGVLNAWSLALESAAVDYSSTDVPKPIPDGDPNGVTSTLDVSATGTIEDLDVILGDITHTCVPDLRIELTSPARTTIRLIASGSGDDGGILVGRGCPDNFLSTVLNDQSPVNLRDGMGPYDSSFNIEHPSVVAMPLSHFNGESFHGTWTLRVVDPVDGDSGTLNAWSLRPRLGPPPPCDGDFDHSGGVTIDELVRAVNNALKGCE
jgi:subtilisin-like proprotein convertase family protein